MNPTFLFNTLDTVAALAVADPARAERVVEHLSAVLRHSLQRADRPFTSVADEMRFVREYLAVEQERLGWRLRVTWDIHDDTLDLRMPTMSVKTLVESTIAGAVEARPAGANIQISSALNPSRQTLRLSVEDSGPGLPAEARNSPGIGELRGRLYAMHERTFDVDQAMLPTGARLTISIPAARFEGGAA
jgi:LytS/YehU family sensor histidine kinase